MIGSLLAVLLLSSATSLEVRVPGPAGTLGGTLTLPARGRAPFPAVVTLTGSGAHYRDGSAVQPEDAVLLERALREGGNRRVERHLFPGVNHHFQRDPVGAREGYDRLPTQDLAPEVLETLCTWLRATLR